MADFRFFNFKIRQWKTQDERLFKLSESEAFMTIGIDFQEAVERARAHFHPVKIEVSSNPDNDIKLQGMYGCEPFGVEIKPGDTEAGRRRIQVDEDIPF